ncbi:MAG: hypothetical protein FIA99_04445 [Ruminiclostridium sp.]|nr:hypothetical protein [Ruminiclostridium sp.]
MYKNNYLRILFIIEDKTGHDGKFDFDRVLDGTYDFNVNDVSKLYELVQIIEKIAAEKELLKCTRQSDTLLKEFKYQFNGKFYQVSRFYDNDEYTFVTENPYNGDEDYVLEQDLMLRIDEKCKVRMDRLSKIYEERGNTSPTG